MQKSKKPEKKVKMFVKTAYGEHLCVFEPDDGGGYIVTAPSLKGVVTGGRTMTEAKKMAREAVELCIECKAEEILVAQKYVKRIMRKPLPVMV